jgi:hypothetical protein
MPDKWSQQELSLLQGFYLGIRRKKKLDRSRHTEK